MKNRKYKVSVVTAVYNVEAYLGEMIESIIAQTIGFENVQLVLVGDGSQDRSGAICEEYAILCQHYHGEKRLFSKPEI